MRTRTAPLPLPRPVLAWWYGLPAELRSHAALLLS